ncbi:MAG: hypothetical protein J3K34DRAFT_204238 [Monoraphidium minutum]|nr:MAG: hypothetical protein J3K34DRAFT_204238 [Monoraphidium minutum]
MSGGQVTFESNSTRRNLGASGGVGVGAASGAAIGGRVDVYGWATLDAMRDNATHECLDWCGDAMRRLGVSPRGHQHVVCFPLYKPDQAAAGAPAVCDNACPSNGACGASCPAGDAYRGLAGCGCGTCYWAWGGQWGCGPQSGRRRHMTGFAAPTATIGRGGPVNLVEGHKVYMAHELGHNLGLTHAASLVCRVENGVINRQATACRPDWYGDVTTFMASASSLTIPAYYKVQQGWLSQHLMQTVTETGRQASYVLRDTNAPPPAAPGGEPRWAKSDVLLLRVAIDASLPAAHACPCPHGACGAAAACQRDDQCGGGPCCIDPECADGGFEFYYVEFSRSPVPRDYGGGGLSGVTIRAAGGLRNCASTRLVPTHAVYGSAQYALSTPDPLGRLPGSMFEDSVRRVAVRLDGMGPDWAQVSVLKY